MKRPLLVSLFLFILPTFRARAAEPPSPALNLFRSDPTLLIAPTYEPTPIAPSHDPAIQSIFFTAKPWHGKPTKVFAYLGIPAHSNSEKLPALVLVHGGGGTAFANWVKLWNDRGYATIAIDTCGSIPLHPTPSGVVASATTSPIKSWTRHENPGPTGWDDAFTQIHDAPQDQWPYHAVADIMLANSLLRSLPDIDKDRIGLTGISWGGYLTCLASAADPRFKFAVPVYGCGYLDQCVWKPELNAMPPADRDAWLTQWDPSHFVGQSQIPILWVDSTNDKNYPLEPLQKTYMLQHSQRTISLNLRMKHAHAPGETPEVIHAYADSFLKNAAPLPQITYVGQDKNPIWTIDTKTKITKTELLYTRDTGPWESRLWESTDAKLTNNTLSATIPPGTTAYFINLTDNRGAVVSSPFIESP